MRAKFQLRPGDPANPMAWLGVAALVRAKRFPFVQFDEVVPTTIGNGAFLKAAVATARGITNGLYWEHPWRRVLLPMLLEEAERRGIDVT